jgi:hypothetical protein
LGCGLCGSVFSGKYDEDKDGSYNIGFAAEDIAEFGPDNEYTCRLPGYHFKILVELNL